MELITLVVMALLCLAFPSTRLFGLLGLALLLYINPFFLILILPAVGIAYYYFRGKFL